MRILITAAALAAAFLLAGPASGPPARAQSLSSALPLLQFTDMQMPGSYQAISACTSSLTREEMLKDPDQPMSVACADPCIEDRLNRWLALGPENRETYFHSGSHGKVADAAGLKQCEAYNQTIYSESACFGPLAPDILVKTFHTSCGEVIECEARFNVDSDGRAVSARATCPDGPVQPELERETLCLLNGMSFAGFRGRRNLVQPFEMRMFRGDHCREP